MEITEMKKRIGEIAATMPASKIDACLGTASATVRQQVAALRFCGLLEGATEFECNVCGTTHTIYITERESETAAADERRRNDVQTPHTIARGGCPCLACDDCYAEFESL